MIIEPVVKPVTRRRRPHITLLGQDLPQPLRVSSLARQPTRHADDGDGHCVVAIIWSQLGISCVRHAPRHIVTAI